jgi:hypothetical protein
MASLFYVEQLILQNFSKVLGYMQMGYPLKAGQLTYDCRYSTMHGMPVTGGPRL